MKNGWSGLSARDRRVLSLGAVLVVALLLWSAVWVPLTRARVALRAQAMSQADALAWMRPAVEAARARGAAVAAKPADDRSLLARVDAQVRARGLAPSLVNVEPQGEHVVRAQFAAVPFDALGDWLQAAAAAGLRVEELSLSRSGDGLVDGRVALGEGGR